MILLDDKLISEDVFEEHFTCDIGKCKGACCIEGDAGAPITQDEVNILDENLKNIKPYLSAESKRFLEKESFWEQGLGDDMEVKCHSNGACIFAVQNNDVLSCGIENAFRDNASNFLKPMSCHLYPIRVSKVGDYLALNYHKWRICNHACSLGKKLGVPLYQFLKEPLIRAFGEDFFQLMDGYYNQELKSK